ncbi:hypothetical protein ACE83Q_05905 [Dellaglioa sp. P0083]|uniref:hypothetical protein n=1 Tax=Dellaglioa kimchii TaxID=3344667 RepID=UPI0038D43CA5
MLSHFDEKNVEVNEKGIPFPADTRVSFETNNEFFTGVVEKQLKNSAIIKFDKEFIKNETAEELKHKIVVSYAGLELIK